MASQYDVIPPASDEERAVLERALALFARDDGGREPRTTSSWWRAGAREAVGSAENEVSLELYALSPRRTRGATRA